MVQEGQKKRSNHSPEKVEGRNAINLQFTVHAIDLAGHARKTQSKVGNVCRILAVLILLFEI